MELLLASVAILIASGAAALLLRGVPGACSRVGAGGVVVAAVLGARPVASVLMGGKPIAFDPLSWPVPNGQFVVGLDLLSAWFLLLVLVVPPLAAVFGVAFLRAYAPRKPVGETWFFYNLVIAGMILVTIARDGLLFLVAWEVMALAAYFLIVFDHEREEVREAGWTYLVASHMGTAFLLVLFLLVGRSSQSLDFVEPGIAARLAKTPAADFSLMFVLAVVGFGTKAGFMPFHVWLPESYPAAVGHAPAMLSGVMSKMGVYGLLRILSVLTSVHEFHPPTWWGVLLLVLGMISGVLGILSAVSQRELRRILAYSSIENMGIIGIGLGTGLLGLSAERPAMAVLGFAGALFHVLNHSLFKGLLFLGAGAVEQSAGTGNINQLGGLLKRLPLVGIPFVAGCVAICGLPPFNGFASEFLIYLTALREEVQLGGVAGVAALGGIAALTLVGGLAAYCFTMVMGIAFLGEPRTAQAAAARPVGRLMEWPLWILAAACLAAGLFSPALMSVLSPVVQNVTNLGADDVDKFLLAAASKSADSYPAQTLLAGVVTVTGGLMIVVLLLALFRRWLLAGREVTASGTWGCGFSAPDATMQYTGSSFAQPLVELVGPLLRTRKDIVRPAGLFAKIATLWTETPDANRELIYAPTFRAIYGAILRLRWLQHGRLHLYVLYVAITIVFLLFWSFGFGA
jgi:formate hydrogenlyase subunit 3/multisubunit Na+/H+ antiporter MnhD subunit